MPHRQTLMKPCLARFLLVFVLCAMSLTVAAATPLHQGVLDGSSFRWQEQADGSYQLLLDGGRPLQVTDAAALPALDLLFLVPPDQPITGVRIEPLAVRTEALPGRLSVAGPLVTSTGETLPVHELSPEGTVFPQTWGQFGGLHTWHGYRLLAVTLHPVRLHAGTDDQDARLEILERYAVHLVTEPGYDSPPPLTRERRVVGERESLEASLQRLVANPIALAGYQRPEGAVLDKQGAPFLPTPSPSLEGSGVRGLIVTVEQFAAAFQQLADWRTEQGVPTLVVTREWIEANHRRGIDFQSTLRMFLQQAYAKWGLEFLLLGGDTEILPTRYVRSTFYPYNGYTDIPTDLYFAALDGDWNANGNGWLAEPWFNEDSPGDDADLAPELAVGRATVRSVQGVQVFVDKVITYESAGAGAAYAGSILFAAEILFPPGNPHQDGAQYAHALVNDVIEPCTDMQYVRMYETDQNFPWDLPLNLNAFIQQLNTGQYGQVNHFGHGHYYNMSVGNASFTVNHADALTNAPNFFLLFALNCATAAFDFSCLNERFLENPNGGSVMSIGAARAAFPTASYNHQESFYQAMSCEGVRRAAVAFNEARMAFIATTWNASSVNRWTQLNATILGDPAVSIWNSTPRVPQIAAPDELEAGEQTVVVTVTVAGLPVSGADVCLFMADETYAWGVTDAAGDAVLTVVPQTTGELTLTVSGMDLERTTLQIPVTSTPAYVRLDEVLVSEVVGNDNGLPEAGETLELYMVLTDVGGAGATNLQANLTSLDDDLVILDSPISVPDVPPGGTITMTDAFVVQIPTAVSDGTNLSFRLTVFGNGGHTYISLGDLEILAPEAEPVRLIIDDSVYGNGDGVPQSGERLVLRPHIKNYGGGRLDTLDVQLSATAPGVTVHEAEAVYGPLGLLEEGTYESGELSLTLDDITTSNAALMLFTDNHGRTFSRAVEFNPPAAPELPDADATLASDAIALRWDPVGGGRTMGYHVYRATAADGPFTRANQDLLLRTSYFEDRGLSQLTPYWYKVTAVDTFLVESPASAVIHQSTMPAQLPNFPLEFGRGTSSHLAVGDVTGDGDLEIVLAADEVYVWRPDGTEIRDGDYDPQTTGPFTNVDGQFEPAGVVLADLDGEPGLEIIVSERSNAREIHVYRNDGTMLDGWPRPLLSSWNWATPAVGDVTGDGFKEVVVNDTGGRTFVWRHDGTGLLNANGLFVQRAESWGYSSPALYDLDGDGAAEIIFGTRYNNSGNGLLAYKADGTLLPGFTPDDEGTNTGTEYVICSPAIADLDGDGSKEIIFFTTERRLFVVRADGSPYPGFPITHPGSSATDPGPSPAVGRFKGDGRMQIVWPINIITGQLNATELVLVDTDYDAGTSGQIMPGWPVMLPSASEASPVVGDINGDGLPDVVQPIGNDDMTTPDLICAFNADGTPVSGFPIRLNGFCRAAPTLCDLNGDGRINIVYGSWDKLLHVWDLPHPYDPVLVTWPTFQGNAQRNGVARQLSVTAVEEVQVPLAFTVLPPYPNPFNPATTIRLYVAPDTGAGLDVAVYDVRGRLVRELHRGQAAAGWLELTWDGRDDSGRGQASGVYFVHARQGGENQTFKLTLVK